MVEISSPRPVRSRQGPRRLAIYAYALVMLVFLRWGIGPASAVLLRPIPWRKCVVLGVWASLAVDLPGSGGLVAALPPPLAAGPLHASTVGQWLSRNLSVCRVEVDVDIAALRSERQMVFLATLPAPVKVADLGLPIGVRSVRRDGTVVLIHGGQQYTLAPQEGLDWALVPDPTGGGWVAAPGPWRPTIEERLLSGLPVGRLSLVNHGLRQKVETTEARPYRQQAQAGDPRLAQLEP